jgi:hypothetical protein
MKKLFFVILSGLICWLFTLSCGGTLCSKVDASEPQQFVGDVSSSPESGECLEENSGVLDIEGIEGKIGEEILIPVRIQFAPQVIGSLGFEVTYDPDILEYLSSQQGNLVASFTMFNVNPSGSGRLRAGGFSTGDGIPQGASGCVVLLKFKVKGGMEGECYPLELENLKDDLAGASPSQGCFCGGDAVPPELTCPASKVVTQMDIHGTQVDDPDVLAFLAEASARDNADGEVAVTNDAPSILPPGKSEITFTAKDSSGNIASCTASITVQQIECEEDETGTLDIEGIQGKIGDEVKIPVRIQNSPNELFALGLEVTYMPSVLEYTGFERGDLVDSFTMFDVKIAGSGRLRAGGLTTADGIPQGASGCVVLLKFKVKGGMEGGCYPLSLANLRDDFTSFSSSHGCFCIHSCNGDLNGDGDVTPSDAFIAFQCYLTADPSCPDCADVNQDGTVSSSDALCIFKRYMGAVSCLDK